MPDEFNPYYVWLGIPSAEQPANYYRLLGITLFEPSADVIDSAADRQTAHLRTFQTGKHADASQRLLNEVATARVCLLDPNKRAEYDRRLRASIAASTPARTASQAALPQAGATPIPAALLRRTPVESPQTLPTVLPTAASGAAPQLPPAADAWHDMLGAPTAKSPPLGASAMSKSIKAAAAKRQAQSRNIAIAAAVGLAVLGAIGFVVYSQIAPADATLVFDLPAVDRSDITASVDTTRLIVPATGPWEYHCPPGSHRVLIERPTYKIAETVSVEAGQKQTVPASWRPKAVLVINWRIADRSGATLTIDGQEQTAPPDEPILWPVEPGRHLVQVSRPGVTPFASSTTVGPEQRESINVPHKPTQAQIVLDWPTSERDDAELTIDGVANKPSTDKSGALQLSVEPGHHVLRIARPGFVAFVSNVDLTPGPNHPIKPVWTPEPKTNDVAAPTAADVLVHPAKKYPIPSAAEQAEVAKQLEEIYKLGKPGVDDAAKAKQLFDVANKPGSSPAERYMLLAKAADSAIRGGDILLGMQAVDAMAADYEIDPLKVKEKLLERFVTVGKPDQVAAAITVADQLVDQAVEADQFELALALATTAGKAAAKGQITSRKETEDRLALKRHELRLMIPMLAEAKTAEETLAADPANPEANSKLGRWRCFYKYDWAGGLPLLAKGRDEKLKAAALQELKAPADAEQQVDVGDIWWDLAKTEGGTARDSIHAHAAEIYRGAMPNLTSALKKAELEKRLAEATAAPHPAPFTVARGAAIYLGDLPPKEVNVLVTYNNEDVQKTYAKESLSPHNLWAHPIGSDSSSHIAYQLDGRFKTLNGAAGVAGTNTTAATPLIFRIVSDGIVLWTSKPLQKSGESSSFHVNVANVTKLELFVDCPGRPDNAFGLWIEPMLEPVSTVASAANPAAAKKEVRYLADLPADEVHVLEHADRNQPDFGFKGVIWPHSIWAHPKQEKPRFSHLAYQVDGRYHTLKGEVGIGRVGVVPATALTFRVVGDGKTLWQSEPMQAPGIAVPFRVDIAKVKKLELYVDCPGPNDRAWAWWIEPTLESLIATVTPSNSLAATVADKTRFRIGQWVDVLSLVDINRDRFSGTWSRNGTSLKGGVEDGSRIGVPVTIEGGYDLAVEFSRATGDADVDVMIPVAANSCLASFSGYNGAGSGLQTVDGESTDLASKNPTVVRPGTLKNGHRYSVLVKVRTDGKDHASVEVALDGKPYFHSWQGNPASLGVLASWGAPVPNHFGLCCSHGGMTFFVCRLRTITGKSTADYAAQADDPPPGVTKTSGTYLADLPASEVRTYALDRPDLQTVFGTKQLTHFVWAHPPGDNSASHVSYSLDGRFKTLHGAVGVSGNTPAESPLTFRIVADGTTLWESPQITATGEPTAFRVDVKNCKKLELFVVCHGSYGRAWAMWIDPVLER